MRSIQASAGSELGKWKNLMRKCTEEDAFNLGKLFIVLTLWFSQPWTFPASIYPLIACSQNELAPSSSKDKLLFHHWSLTLISGLHRALTQTKVHSEMSTPVYALKFHIWLFHTIWTAFLHLSLLLSLRAGTPSSSVCRAQLNQWYGDFLILMPGHCCHFSPCLLAMLFCKLKRDGCCLISSTSFPTCMCSEFWNLGVSLLHVRNRSPQTFHIGTRRTLFMQLNTLNDKRFQKVWAKMHILPVSRKPCIRARSYMSASSTR